ncbi:MAG: single-stranded-DNA-specific exonuclease RecJ, partial [Pseudomonadota bacterium]
WAKRAGEAHLRFTATDGSSGKLEAIAFRAFEGPLGEFLMNRNGKPVHLAGRIEVDDWGGRRKAKLRVEDAAEPT